jgi:hypothetical protein
MVENLFIMSSIFRDIVQSCKDLSINILQMEIFGVRAHR